MKCFIWLEMFLPSYIFCFATLFLREQKGIITKAKLTISEFDKEIQVQWFKKLSRDDI